MQATGENDQEDRRQPLRRLVILIFVLSGAAGLIYEVVWARQLVLVFGNTTQAISAILTGFFGGMAAGSFLGGRLADRMRRPLLVYASIEVLLAAVVLTTPLLFAGLDVVYRSSYSGAQTQPGLLALLKFGLAIAALAPATMLMGTTLPMLTRYMTVSHRDLANEFGRLYAANTLGGIVGTALSGYLLIELFGLSVTLLVGALFSTLAGIAALLVASTDTVARAQPPSKTPVARDPGTVSRRLILLIAFVSGMTSLGYQVLWTRLLSSGTDNASYVFTTILVVFLAGIALGARIHGAGIGRRLGRLELLGASQILVGLVAVGGVWILGSPEFGRPRFLLVLVATTVMGFALPVAAGLLGRDDRRVGGDAGLLLAANTAGVVVGTFVVPFVLIPAVGSVHSILLLGAANGGLGCLLVMRRPVTAWRRVALGVGAGVLAVTVIGPLLAPTVMRFPHALAVAREGVLYASAEDEIAAVEAGTHDGKAHLWVGGLSMTVLSVDAKLMPLLPLMTRPASKSALVIAFGMGSSFRSSLIAGLRTDAVELVPSVPGMFHFYYSDAAEVLADPRGRLVVADGRNYVQLSQARYDIIVVDPPPPVRSAGTGVLYSREFYEAAAQRLNPEGVLMEWMPYAQQSVDEFRAQMRTFLAVFPNALFVLSPTDLGIYMLGSSGPMRLDPASVRHVLERPGVLHDLASAPDALGVTVDDWARRIPALLWTKGDEAREFSANSPVITDDRPYTEYFLLSDLFGPPQFEMSKANLVALLEAFRAG